MTNIKVLYHSSTGNSRRIAEAIAASLHVSAKPIDGATQITESVDLLLLGDGVYFGKPSKDLRAFINQLDPALIRHAAVFATYGGMAQIGSDLVRLLTDRGIDTVREPFTCKGQSWMLLNRHHPSESDLSAARDYAKAVLKTISPEE